MKKLIFILFLVVGVLWLVGALAGAQDGRPQCVYDPPGTTNAVNAPCYSALWAVATDTNGLQGTSPRNIVNVDPAPVATLTVYVFTPAGPLAGATVAVTNQLGQAAQATTATDGTVELRATAGDMVHITATAPGYTVTPAAYDVTATDSGYSFSAATVPTPTPTPTPRPTPCVKRGNSGKCK